MRNQQLVCERPSVLPVLAVDRVRGLLSDPVGRIDRAVDHCVSYPGGTLRGDVVASLALRADALTFGQPDGQHVSGQASPDSVIRMEDKQSMAGRVHTTTAIGGAPPRGRPN